MLVKTADHLRDQLIELRRLEQMAAEQGVTVDEPLRNDDFGGPDWTAHNINRYEASNKPVSKKQRSESQQATNLDGEVGDLD